MPSEFTRKENRVSAWYNVTLSVNGKKFTHNIKAITINQAIKNAITQVFTYYINYEGKEEPVTEIKVLEVR